MSNLPPAFPEFGSIPPVCFYNMGGLTSWLNANPDYKQYFVNYPRYYPYLYTQSTISELVAAGIGAGISSVYNIYENYDIRKVKLSPLVTTLNDYQANKYKEQLNIFLKVYSFNSNAYITSLETGAPPIYYRFRKSSELLEYRSALGLISKLYPFDAMANGTSEYGSTLGWVIPFPL